MNPRERDGIIDILRSLPDVDLRAIVDTTTKHLVQAENTEEAIKVIVTYTENAAVLLRRKKIRKQSLFNYLRKHDVVVSINAEKIDYIRACLNLWNSNIDEVESMIFQDDSVESYEELEPTVNQHPLPSVSTEDANQLGIEFAKWFFQNLNTQQDFGPHHFWPDCKLNLLQNVVGSELPEEFSTVGAGNVSRTFVNCIMERKLLFQPNLSLDGIKSQLEPHGLVKVLVSGIVYQMENCIGVYDMTFGLISDPLSNFSWKVKMIYAVLHINAKTASIQQSASLLPVC